MPHSAFELSTTSARFRRLLERLIRLEEHQPEAGLRLERWSDEAEVVYLPDLVLTHAVDVDLVQC
jgi:hypothetical protein